MYEVDLTFAFWEELLVPAPEQPPIAAIIEIASNPAIHFLRITSSLDLFSSQISEM